MKRCSRHTFNTSDSRQPICDDQLRWSKIRVSAGLPLQWATPAADLLQQGDDLGSFYVEINPLIWQRVQKIMHRSGHAQGAASGAPA